MQLQKEKSVGNAAKEDAAALNADDFIGDVQVTTLLEFRRDNFALDRILGYMEPKVRKQFNGDEFTGTLTEAQALITALRHYYEKNSRACPHPHTHPSASFFLRQKRAFERRARQGIQKLSEVL